MADEYSAGGRTFEFDRHGTNWGYNSRISAYIKFHHFAKLPKKAQTRLDRLVEVKHVEEYAIENHAFETAQEDWWEWAKERVAEYGLGEIHSAGRCGGYLVLWEYPPDRIETLCESVNEECKNCRAPFAEHAEGGHCLFDSTTFLTSDPDALETLENIEKFIKECEESISSWAKENYDFRLREEIDYQWSEWRATIRRQRHEETIALGA